MGGVHEEVAGGGGGGDCEEGGRMVWPEWVVGEFFLFSFFGLMGVVGQGRGSVGLVDCVD